MEDFLRNLMMDFLLFGVLSKFVDLGKLDKLFPTLLLLGFEGEGLNNLRLKILCFLKRKQYIRYRESKRQK
jgi:hypothetical protein